LADTPIRVERYCEADQAALAALLAELDPEHAERLPEHLTRLLALLAIDAAAILVVRDATDPADQLIAALTLERTYWNATSYVADLIVHDGWRNQGIGAALIEEARAVSRGWGCRRIYLTTGSTNRGAQLFYLRQGFVPEGFRPDYSGPGDHEISLFLDL
jgi:GNAT superfamily N-acetyltransferase